jgi:hypothetical protein
VPNLPQPWQLLAVNATTTAANTPASTTTTPNGRTKRLFRKQPQQETGIVHELSVFPKKVTDAIKKLF